VFDPLFFVLLLLSYLIGSLSTAIVVCKLFRLPDPRKEGSGNPGATNVLRLGGKRAAIITLLGDFLKGVIPVAVALYVFKLSALPLACCGLAAFFGHIFPIYFRFQGGKGVATGLGVLLGWYPPAFLIAGVIWLAMAFLTRYSSLSALSAFLLTPLVLLLFSHDPWLVFSAGILAVTLVITHRENINRLISGKEKKIQLRRKTAS
jgi:glycerol-3-phosphate acyltransferase PlsY